MARERKWMFVAAVWGWSAAAWAATSMPQGKASLEGHWLPYGMVMRADGSLHPINAKAGETTVVEVDKAQYSFVTHFDNSPNVSSTDFDFRVLGTDAGESKTSYVTIRRQHGDGMPVIAQRFEVSADGLTLTAMQVVNLNGANAGECFGRVFNDYLRLNQLDECPDLAQKVSDAVRSSTLMFQCKRLDDRQMEKVEAKGQAVAKAASAAERKNYVRKAGKCLWLTAMASPDGARIGAHKGLVVAKSSQGGRVVYRIKFMEPYGGLTGYLDVPESMVLAREWGACP